MSTKITITGTIRRVNAAVTRSTEKGDFTSQSIVVNIDEDSKYPQAIQVELSKKLIEGAIGETLPEGLAVEIDVNLTGRDYPDRNTGELKNFTTLQAWNIRRQQGQPDPSPYVQQELPGMEIPAQDDLPF